MQKVMIKLYIHHTETEYNISQVRDIISEICKDPYVIKLIKDKLDSKTDPVIYSTASYAGLYERKE
jgi:hypothetical protein